MTKLEVQEIHARINDTEERLCQKIDALSQKTTQLVESIAGVVAKCGICGKTVLGNGKPPLGERMSSVEALKGNMEGLWSAHNADHDELTRLKERDETRVRIGWKALTVVVAAAGMAFTAIQLALNYLGR